MNCKILRQQCLKHMRVALRHQTIADYRLGVAKGFYESLCYLKPDDVPRQMREHLFKRLVLVNKIHVARMEAIKPTFPYRFRG